MAITNSNLFSQSYTVIKDFLNTNITDPKRRYKKEWIHPSLPNITDQGFDGYPFIVIQVDLDEDIKSFDRSTSNKTFRALIGIYSQKATEVDSVSDEVLSKFKNETLTDNLSEFKSIEVASAPFEFEIIGGRKIQRRLIGLMGKKRI